MPLYDYRCQGTCGKRFTRFLPLSDYARPQECCHVPAQKLVSAPMVLGDYAGYECPVSGRWVEGRRAHKENLARTGCRVFEPGEREAFQRRRQADEARFDAELDQTADRLISELPAEKRERLAAEMDHGLDVSYTRN